MKDFGIRGLDLAYALLDPYDLVILVDACARGGEPGTVYLIEPDPVGRRTLQRPHLETHAMNPMSVLRMVKSMGGRRAGFCSWAASPPTSDRMKKASLGLSEPVAGRGRRSVAMIETLVSKVLDGEPRSSTAIALEKRRRHVNGTYEHTNGQRSNETRDTLFLLGGAALIVFGAGLILSTPMCAATSAAWESGTWCRPRIPDFERYMKLRAM